MPWSDGKEYESRIMKPIIEKSDFNLLRRAGLIWFDHKMNPDNIYGFDIPKLVKVAKDMLDSKQSKEKD